MATETATNGAQVQYKATNTSGPLIRNDYFIEKLLRILPRKRLISGLGDSQEMRKHSGSTMKVSKLVPLLDVKNTAGKGLDNAGEVIASGALWGGSVDIATIKAISIGLSELGIRQNEVSFTRENITSTFVTNGIFSEQTVEFINKIDSPEIAEAMWEEMVIGALEIVETNATIRLLEGASTKLYAGAATTRATMTGASTDTSLVTVKGLHRMSTTLDNNKTPRYTEIMTGSTNYGTVTLNNTRICFIHPDLIYQLTMLKDANDNSVWKSVEEFAYSAKFMAMSKKYDQMGVLDGIVGAIGNIMFCAIPEMPLWQGEGASYTGSDYKSTNSKVDVYPMMIIGAKSFFNIMWNPDMIDRGLSQVNGLLLGELRPETSREDPFARIHVQSVQWSEGTLITYPERIAVLHTICET